MRDIDVRRVVLADLKAQHAHDRDTRIVEEMGVWAGSARIDVAVINGELSGFELKSDRDTLERLPAQVGIYSKVFDKVNLVVGSKHLDKARRQIPRWWGIMEAANKRGGVKIKQHRAALENPEIVPGVLIELLRKDELIHILSERSLARGLRSASLRTIQLAVLNSCELTELRFLVRRSLKARENWLGQKAAHNLDVAVDA